MIIKEISYAITGEALPVSGLKVDVSKPEGVISGAFPVKNMWIWRNFSFDIKGGVTDKNFNFLKGFKNISSAIEARPSFHLVPAWSSGKYGYLPEATHNKLLVLANNSVVDQAYICLKDTLDVINLLKEYHTAPLKNIKSRSQQASIDQYSTPIDLAILNDSGNKKIAIHFVNKISNGTEPPLADNATVDQIMKRLGQLEVDSNAIGTGYLSNYKPDIYKYYKLYHGRNSHEVKNKLKIENALDIWTKKSYYWFTLSPFIRAEGINAYHNKYKDQDSLYFKSENSWYYGGTLLFNQYYLFPKRFAHLIRTSITLSHSNNLATLKPFNYETSTPLYQAGNSITQRTSSGSAYSFDQLKSGFLKSFSAEYYFLPLKTLIPGGYVSANVNNSKLYNLSDYVGRENDSWLIGAEGGLIFNINSREAGKEKNIFSILTYIRHEDITDKRRTPIKTGVEESAEDYNKRNWSIGIKVGIPINLPQ
ncbi:hypothetical protein D3C73_540460 [compost metagenome]